MSDDNQQDTFDLNYNGPQVVKILNSSTLTEEEKKKVVFDEQKALEQQAIKMEEAGKPRITSIDNSIHNFQYVPEQHKTPELCEMSVRKYGCNLSAACR